MTAVTMTRVSQLVTRRQDARLVDASPAVAGLRTNTENSDKDEVGHAEWLAWHSIVVLTVTAWCSEGRETAAMGRQAQRKRSYVDEGFLTGPNVRPY